jgi:hypothetical protein
MNCYPAPFCRCCECQGIHCFIPHVGHSHRDRFPSYFPGWPLGPSPADFEEYTALTTREDPRVNNLRDACDA